ncbi:nucleotide-binding alpha-beta plait domain-containing protein [Tanacetum coccineum]
MDREREEKDDGWQKVTRKHKSNKNNTNHHWKNQHIPNLGGRSRRTNFDKILRDKATSLFFTNFTDSWDSTALWKMFSRYGKVVDGYIAFKKMKKDTRFGFVRFINFRHLETFERRLKEILIRESRLVINRAKFFKGGNVVLPPSDFPLLNSHKSKAGKSHSSHSFKEIDLVGLPALGRNVGAIKTILNEFGHVLEIGRLNFDSKLLLPIKALMLISSMNEIRKTLLVTLNGKSYPIRVYEESFNVASQLTLSSFSDDGSSFEEEFVGPSTDLDGGDAKFSGDIEKWKMLLHFTE